MGGNTARRQSKKLSEAAAFWARGGKHDEADALADLTLFGVASDAAQEWIGEQPAEEFDVWPENWQTAQLFLLLQTQWRVAFGIAGGGRIGLDYAAAHAAMQMLGIQRKERQDTFMGLCVMERAALPLLNTKRG